MEVLVIDAHEAVDDEVVTARRYLSRGLEAARTGHVAGIVSDYDVNGVYVPAVAVVAGGGVYGAGEPYIWLVPVSATRRSVTGPVEVRAWRIDESVHTPATRWHPEDHDVREHGTYDSLQAAVAELVLLIVRNEVLHALRALAEEDAAGGFE
jgi:hypothetical protein